jgi:hypothetical protein
MVDSSVNSDGTLILSPHDAHRLGLACPNLHVWSQSWHIEPADIAVGQKIVQALTPFLLHLLNQGLAKTTVRRHRDNLWLLGGEIIRRRHNDDALARQDVTDALSQLIDADGGPLMLPRISESEQDSLDATCRNLHRFMGGSATVSPSV